MAIGCIICAEAFAGADPPEKHPMVIRICGHAFHNFCIRQWLSKSKTCPVCRCTTLDTTAHISRLHLQSVNNLDSSQIYVEPTLEAVMKDSLVIASKKELEDAKKGIADAKQKVLKYISEVEKNLSHIKIEVGTWKEDENRNSVIDLTDNSVREASSGHGTASVISSHTATSQDTASTTSARPVVTRPMLRPIVRGTVASAAAATLNRNRLLATRGRAASSTSLTSHK